MQKYYKAEMDRTLKITTGAVWAALVLLPAGLAVLRYLPGCSDCGSCGRPGVVLPAWLIAGLTLMLAAIVYFTRALAPRGFALNDIELVIDRTLRPVKIPLASITETRRLEAAEMKLTLRLMGASGFYGHYGWFWNKTLGKFRLYSGRFNNLVLARSGKTIFILGPEDPDTFITDLRALTHR